MFIPPDGELDYKSRLVVQLKMSSAVYLNEILSFVCYVFQNNVLLNAF